MTSWDSRYNICNYDIIDSISVINSDGTDIILTRGGLSFSSRVMTLIAVAGVLRYIGFITIGDDVDGVANDALDDMGGEMIFGGG